MLWTLPVSTALYILCMISVKTKQRDKAFVTSNNKWLKSSCNWLRNPENCNKLITINKMVLVRKIKPTRKAFKEWQFLFYWMAHGTQFGSEPRLNRMEGFDAEGGGPNSAAFWIFSGISEYEYLGFFPKRISKVEKQLERKKLN